MARGRISLQTESSLHGCVFLQICLEGVIKRTLECLALLSSSSSHIVNIIRGINLTTSFELFLPEEAIPPELTSPELM